MKKCFYGLVLALTVWAPLSLSMGEGSMPMCSIGGDCGSTNSCGSMAALCDNGSGNSYGCSVFNGDYSSFTPCATSSSALCALTTQPDCSSLAPLSFSYISEHPGLLDNCTVAPTTSNILHSLSSTPDNSALVPLQNPNTSCLTELGHVVQSLNPLPLKCVTLGEQEPSDESNSASETDGSQSSRIMPLLKSLGAFSLRTASMTLKMSKVSPAAQMLSRAISLFTKGPKTHTHSSSVVHALNRAVPTRYSPGMTIPTLESILHSPSQETESSADSESFVQDIPVLTQTATTLARYDETVSRSDAMVLENLVAQTYTDRITALINGLQTMQSKSISNEQARDKAAEWGYKEIKQDGGRGTNGPPQFKKGSKVIVPDQAGHGASTWKLFTRKGKRLGTLDANGNKIKH